MKVLCVFSLYYQNQRNCTCSCVFVLLIMYQILVVLKNAAYKTSTVQGCNGRESLIDSPLTGKQFVLAGAGGAGRALAVGAKIRDARVVVFDIDPGRILTNLILKKHVIILYIMWELRGFNC